MPEVQVEKEVSPNKFLTEDEAANLCGITGETIRKYRDLGLLSAHRINGADHYTAAELEIIFGSKRARKANAIQKTPQESIPRKASEEAAQVTESASSEAVSSNDIPETSLEGPPPNAEPGQKTDIKRSTSTQDSADFLSMSKESPANHQNPVDNGDEKPPRLSEILDAASSDATMANNSNTSGNFSGDHSRHPSDEKTTYAFHGHEERNTYNIGDISSIELLELTKSLKDQIQVIKEERNWLRKRVERLETTLEREQMIVMSKVETVRTLVARGEPRKKNRPWSFLLPWKDD